MIYPYLKKMFCVDFENSRYDEIFVGSVCRRRLKDKAKVLYVQHMHMQDDISVLSTHCACMRQNAMHLGNCHDLMQGRMFRASLYPWMLGPSAVKRWKKQGLREWAAMSAT